MHPQHGLDLKGVTVLIVDDQDPMRKALRRICTEIGLENLIETVDVSDSIKALATTTVHIVLCDLYLRTKQGSRILEYIRNRDVFNDIPVIMISGEDGKERIVKMMSDGANDFIVKPFQVGEIEKKIVTQLQRYLKPSPVAKLLQVGDQAFTKNNPEAALKAYRKALELAPQSPRTILSVGLALMKLKKYDEGKAQLEVGIKIAPEYYKFFRTLADVSIERGDYPQAVDWLKKELTINPNQQNRQTLIANLLLQQSDPEGALEHLKVALLEEATYYKALMTTAKAYVMMDNQQKAIYYFMRARRSDPKASEPLLAAMEIFYRAGQPDKAEFLLKDEKKSYPGRLDTFLLLAQHYVREKQFDEAEAQLTELLAKDKDNEGALKLMNKIKQGRVQKAG